MQNRTDDNAAILQEIASIPNIEKLNDGDIDKLITEIRQALSVE